MKRAFTLIELLVVIAIIAILAAILFPVFAQAKEAAKKTTTLSQYKQVGTSSQIYLSDSDDTFPLGFSFNSAGNQWRAQNYHSVPNGATGSAGRDAEPRKSEEGMFVLNSLQPYAKNYQIFQANGLANTSIAAQPQSTVAGAPKQAPVNITMNGLLHAWSATAVASPSKLPLFWAGNFKENVVGVSTSNPLLWCIEPGEACRFNPSGGAQGNPANTYAWFGAASPGNFTVFVYGKGMPFVAADTSARFIQFNAPKYPQYAQNANTSPFSSFDPTGVEGTPYWITDCNPGGAYNANAIWPGFFRPDSEFNYAPEQCQFTG
ncbi:prepilin-type N-terminal cleavage/methylation domain-containing protein [bacterium]|nr:MAG: prepilin-type N-terminal cleavage/methylation domain-containing protein [bacterium]